MFVACAAASSLATQEIRAVGSRVERRNMTLHLMAVAVPSWLRAPSGRFGRAPQFYQPPAHTGSQ